MWDEERNSHLFMAKALEEACKLLELMSDHDMDMAFPKDIPTLEAKSTKNWTCPDNVFCSMNSVDAIVSCDTNPGLRGPGADHVPILTVLDLQVQRAVTAPVYNFRTTDWDSFGKEMRARLEDIDALCQL